MAKKKKQQKTNKQTNKQKPQKVGFTVGRTDAR